jgi:hypothetical protein
VNLTPTIPSEARSTCCGPRPPQLDTRSTSPAFTLVEILTTVALLAFIVVGLFAVFNQVQRAFRSSMNQVDQLEAGRAVTDMLPRELEQMVPAGFVYPNGVNFYAQIPVSTPLVQSLPGGPIQRTNLLEDCFLLVRQNQSWVGIGYCVRTNDAQGRLWLPECGPNQMGVGTLYRFTATTNILYEATGADPRNGLGQDPSQLYLAFLAAAQPGSAASQTSFNRICDGVIHFRFRAFNTNGVLITAPLRLATDVIYSTVAPGEIGTYRFCSNTVPASVELELGMLEQRSWERYNAIGAGSARLAYIQREDISSRVHLFRQRIPIRNVDPAAYQ